MFLTVTSSVSVGSKHLEPYLVATHAYLYGDIFRRVGFIHGTGQGEQQQWEPNDEDQEEQEQASYTILHQRFALPPTRCWVFLCVRHKAATLIQRLILSSNVSVKDIQWSLFPRPRKMCPLTRETFIPECEMKHGDVGSHHARSSTRLHGPIVTRVVR